MWNSLLDNARTLAAQAKAAAEKLEDTINVSVGAPPINNTISTYNTTDSIGGGVGGLGTKTSNFDPLDNHVDLWEDTNMSMFDSDILGGEIESNEIDGDPSIQHKQTFQNQDQDQPSISDIPQEEKEDVAKDENVLVHNVPPRDSIQSSYITEDPMNNNDDDVDDVGEENNAWNFSIQDTVVFDDDQTQVPHHQYSQPSTTLQHTQPQTQQADGSTVEGLDLSVVPHHDNTNPITSIPTIQEIHPSTETESITTVIDSTMEDSTTSSSSTVIPSSDSIVEGSSSSLASFSSSSLIQQLQTQIQQLQQHVAARELQLSSKSEQITTMLELHHKEKETFVQQVRETKEEAKKRILVAKERVTELQQHIVRLETELATHSSTSQESSIQKDELIQALRVEGEALAKKMSEVEQRAKDTRIQLLNVQDELTTQLSLKEKMEKKIHDLEMEVKSIKTKLSTAQQGEVRAEQLETTVLELREEGEIKNAKIISLETEVKEYKVQLNT